jgi:hypothetical protein
MFRKTILTLFTGVAMALACFAQEQGIRCFLMILKTTRTHLKTGSRREPNRSSPTVKSDSAVGIEISHPGRFLCGSRYYLHFR